MNNNITPVPVESLAETNFEKDFNIAAKEVGGKTIRVRWLALLARIKGEAKNEAISTIKGGVSADKDNLAKLVSWVSQMSISGSGIDMNAIHANIRGNVPADKDTLEKLVNYMHNMKIGGKNLYENGDFEQGNTFTVGTLVGPVFDIGLRVKYGTKCLYNETGTAKDMYTYGTDTVISPNTDYIFSFSFCCAGAIVRHSSFSEFLDSSKTMFEYVITGQDVSKGKDWIRCVFKFKSPANAHYFRPRIGIYTNGPGWFAVDGIQLQEGIVATEYINTLKKPLYGDSISVKSLKITP